MSKNPKTRNDGLRKYYRKAFDIVEKVNKVTFADSFANMRSMIKKSKGLFLRVLLLVLLPVLIMNCYTFYTQYSDLEINYGAMDSIDFSRLLNGDATVIQDYMDSVMNVFGTAEAKTTAADIVFEIVNFVIGAFADAFIISLGICLAGNRKYAIADISKLALKNLFAVMFFDILSYWVISEAQTIVMPGIMLVAVFAHVKNTSLLIASLTSLVIEILIGMLIACWAMLFIYYMMITTVIGRNRPVMALGYSREILRKKVFGQMFHISPFIVGSFLIPTLMQGFTMFLVEELVPAIIIAALSIIIEVVFNMLIWMYIIPDYLVLEKESGIQEKLHDLIEKAIQRQQEIFNEKKSRKHGDTENVGSNDTDSDDTDNDDTGFCDPEVKDTDASQNDGGEVQNDIENVDKEK